MCGFPYDNNRVQVSSGATFSANSQNKNLKWTGLPWKNNRVHVSLGATLSANSQNRNLKRASIWRAKCVDFFRKMIGFRCRWVRRSARIRRT
jgi:hypothetical protein